MTEVYSSRHGKLPHPGQVPLEAGIHPVHPGVFFFKEFLQPRGVDVSVAAKEMHLPVAILNDIIAGRRAVDDDMADRLGKFTETSPRVWLNMQAATVYADAKAAFKGA